MVLEFMDNIKNDHYYLEKIKKDIAFIANSVSTQQKKSNPFIRKAPVWMSIAASFALIIWSGVGFYNYQYNMGLADEYVLLRHLLCNGSVCIAVLGR